MALADDSSSGIGNIQRTQGVRPDGDLIFMSVDDNGARGALNGSVLRQLDLDTSIIPKAKELLPGYAIRRIGDRLLCFVVTVGRDTTATMLATNLQNALNDSQLMLARHLWIPLMGTGTGKLSHAQSDDIITATLKNTPWCNARNIRIDLAYPLEVAPVGHIPLPQSQSVKIALQLAWKLNNDRIQPGNSVTTSLLFFALVEGQANITTFELHGDSPAALFSEAVHSLAGEDRYQACWREYFGTEYMVVNSTLPHFNGELSKNVQAVLEIAERRAREQRHNSIEMDDLIDSMLSYRNGRYRRVLESMELSPTQLLEAYRDAMAGAIGTMLLNDVASGTDRLGYAAYTEAIASFLRDPKTPPPLSISIQAPWGAGKSSLMQQIRENLDPQIDRDKHKTSLQDAITGFCHIKLKQALSYLDRKPDVPARDNNRSGRFRSLWKKLHGTRTHERTTPKDQGTVDSRQLWTVWFNAWKYDTSEQVWSGLVDAIVSQISGRLPPEQRELFLFRLQLARIDDGIVRRKIYDRILTIWWNKIRKWFLLGTGALATSVGVDHFMAKTLPPPGLSVLIALSPAVITAILGAYLFTSYWISSTKTQEEPASFSLAPYLKVPDYDQTLGSIHHIHKDLLRVLSLTPRNKETSAQSPIAIFIDDLDRCSPSKVASVVEGVNMFLASDEYQCMFVIGMDPQMIAAALEEAHAKVLDQLPSFEYTVPLGWRFMDKFIQLPFTIPPNNNDRLKSYIDWLATPSDVVNNRTHPSPTSLQPSANTINPTSGSAPPPAQVTVTEAVTQISPPTAQERFRESRDVGIIIREAAASTSGNPREIKRLTNLARLYLGLRNARQRDMPSWQAPGLSQYARWITLTLRWPDMMRWLQWGADECSWDSEPASRNLQERRLHVLEQKAAAANDPKAWEEGVTNALKVTSGKTASWIKDAKLFEFFKAESTLKEYERLSAAVAKGFW
jgi:hypothetical protein